MLTAVRTVDVVPAVCGSEDVVVRLQTVRMVFLRLGLAGSGGVDL